MADATVLKTEGISVSPWSGEGFAQKLGLSGFEGSKKYFIWVTFGISSHDGSVAADFEIRIGTTVHFAGKLDTGVNSKAEQVSWFTVYDQPATPDIVALHVKNESAGTLRVGQAQVIAIKLSDDFTEGEDWEYNENTTLTEHTTSPVGFASVTLDQADGVKDWLVFAMEEVIVDSASVNYDGEIYDGTSSFMVTSKEGEDDTEQTAYTIFRTFNDVAADTVFTFRASDDQTGVNDHLKSRVFALNLNKFANHKSVYSSTPVSIGSGMTEVSNLNSGGNYTPDDTGDQIIFAQYINGPDSANAEWLDQLQVNGVTTPTLWDWEDGDWNGLRSYDNSDEIPSSIATVISIPDTGHLIDMDAQEVSGNSQDANEMSMTVFSVAFPVESIDMPPTTATEGSRTSGSPADFVSRRFRNS